MGELKIYEIDRAYIDYLGRHDSKIIHNSTSTQANERKYLGVVMEINGVHYFVPLSSFKPKHEGMKETTDFIKVKKYAVINLNNMFPAPLSVCRYVDFSTVTDAKYRNLLIAEYRFIKSIQEKITRNAAVVYNHRLQNGDTTPLGKRSNDFTKLESAYHNYNKP